MVYEQHKTIYIQVTRTSSNSIHSLLGNEIQLSLPLTHETYTNAVLNKAANGEDVSNYYSFSTVRNPYDRFVSAYVFFTNIFPQSTLSFDESLDRLLNFLPDWWNNTFTLYRPQWYYICDENYNILVDDICRFENLESDWVNIANKINTNNPNSNISTTLPNLNGSVGRDEWMTYYEGEIGLERINKINTLYERDFNIFNYTKLN
jgi:hypothetical protein